jgi:hypothetical protein
VLNIIVVLLCSPVS